ncbi:hypothetical protein LT42_06100 [Pseudomonas lutea]|uniref:Uncharacterized protein n=1 Tax=Pseudomonas lutea TaxID=243924 RepID=A0A9X0EGK6_9PSED|nr:hypothetical protein LT42_06100 [Pseudomonas lutea]
MWSAGVITGNHSAPIVLFPAKAGPTKHRMHSVGPASAGKLLTLIVPTLCVGMPDWTLRVSWLTQSVRGCMPTRSVGTIIIINRNHRCSNWPLPG